MKVGDELPAWELPVTPTFVVSSAISTRDFQDVHHDRDRAQAAGSKDIFVNILTSTALCERYVTEWAGNDVQITGVAIRLGAPAYPYDTLTFSGKVVDVADGSATIEVTAAVEVGNHIIGTVTVQVDEDVA
jgi:acyl dehydratase